MYLTPAFLIYSSRRPSSIMFSAIPLDYHYAESMKPLNVQLAHEKHASYVEYLLQILHESAGIVSAALKNHESSRNHLELAKAWVGVDVNAWQRHIPYQAAVYALLKSVLEIGNMFNDKHPVHNILIPKIHLVLESLEYQLNKRDPKLAKWFMTEQLPALIKYIMPALERHASKHVESGIAVIILAATCCVAITKLDAQRISCPTFSMSLSDTICTLVESSTDFPSMDVLHHLASKSGIEHEFLNYFGPKVLNHDARENIVFWMKLIQEKLVAALRREYVVKNLQKFCHAEVVTKDLAVIGLFAFLGRKTRLFLTKMGIKDLDEPVNDFICYLECGIIFLYPELSSICVYQLFMEVVYEEIAWLDLYAAVPSTRHQEKKRLKPHAIRAETEIILSAVFGVCSDMFSCFPFYIQKTDQSLNPNLEAYLQVSKSLLTSCLEDYLAAYDRLCDFGELVQLQFSEPVMRKGDLVKVISSFPNKQCPKRTEVLKMNLDNECTPQDVPEIGKISCSDKILAKLPEAAESKLHFSFLAKSSSFLLSTTYDIVMGTRLLFLDLSVTIGFVQKLLFRRSLTERERKKIVITVTDVACVIPILILMIIPLTAIGHAAMLTAIKKYTPHLIPSPYSSERLSVIKQLKRAKKMRAQSCGN